MKYTSVTNLQWNVDHSAVDCVVDFEGLGPLPFSASPKDKLEHGQEIYARCIAGDFGPIEEFVLIRDDEKTGPLPEQLLPITDTQAFL